MMNRESRGFTIELDFFHFGKRERAAQQDLSATARIVLEGSFVADANQPFPQLNARGRDRVVS
jgi:hypothetical protein